MPRDTPLAISSNVPPSNFESETPLICASASQRAFSTPLLAISCPRILASSAGQSEAALIVFPISEGATKSEITCQAVSVVSELYPGVSLAVTSPHPLTPSATTSTRMILRWCETPKLVSNGAFSRICTSRNVMDSIFITLQKVCPLHFVKLESHGRAAVGNVRKELLADPCLNLLRGQRFISADPPDVSGNSDPCAM